MASQVLGRQWCGFGGGVSPAIESIDGDLIRVWRHGGDVHRALLALYVSYRLLRRWSMNCLRARIPKIQALELFDLLQSEANIKVLDVARHGGWHGLGRRALRGLRRWK